MKVLSTLDVGRRNQSFHVDVMRDVWEPIRICNVAVAGVVAPQKARYATCHGRYRCCSVEFVLTHLPAGRGKGSKGRGKGSTSCHVRSGDGGEHPGKSGRSRG